jgi:hypothetical protein
VAAARGGAGDGKPDHAGADDENLHALSLVT